MTMQQVGDIPKLTHQEAGWLAQTAYERLLALLESLNGENWSRPTYCTEWNVRHMAAHLAGSMTGSTTFAEFRRQNVEHPYVKEFGSPDGANKLQVEERADKTTAELIAEFRQNGQIAVNNRKKLPWLVRKIHLPMGSLGFASIEYLMDVIYVRDEWMHRYDICAATGKKMVVTPEHDGRIVALILRDVARKLKSELKGRTIALHLLGEAGGDYLFGSSSSPDCSLEIDVFDFNLRASGRISAGEATRRTAVTGDHTLTEWFLDHMEVPY
jgi:uncharacterized protein (TIGR03083 family)